MSDNAVSTPKWIYPASLAASLLAVADSLYLTNLHKLRHTKEIQSSLCTISDVANCQITIESRYSELFGIPISNFSAVTYGLIAALAIIGLLDGRKAFPRLLLLGGAFTTVVSLVMAFISYVVLKTVCPACTLLYVCSFVLAFTGYKAVGTDTSGEALGDEFARFFAAKPLGVSAAVTAAVLAAVAGISTSKGHLEAINQKDTTVTPPPEKAAKEPSREEAMKIVGKFMDAMPQINIDCGPLEPKGNPQAKVTLIEFADFQCPACKAFVPALNSLLETHSDKVRVCYRNFPLDSDCNSRIPKGRGHKHACDAAAASVCASRQGKLWDFYHAMFAMQGPGLNPESISRLAKEKGLDTREFESCLKSDSVKQIISADLDKGVEVGVQGTPTVIVNGRLLKQRPDAALLRIIVDYESSKP